MPLAHMAGLLVGLGHARVNGQRLPAADAFASGTGADSSAMQGRTGPGQWHVGDDRRCRPWRRTKRRGCCNGWSCSPPVCFKRWAANRKCCASRRKKRAAFADNRRSLGASAIHCAHILSSRGALTSINGVRSQASGSGAEIQDPYSLRCAPQILGAFQEAHWHVEQVVTRELNASTDNPLIFPDTGMVIHCGNFYGQQVAMVSDYLRIGLIKLALLADRQIERLVNWRYSRGLPPLLAGGAPGLNSGLAGAQLLATSLAAEAGLLGTAAPFKQFPPTPTIRTS